MKVSQGSITVQRTIAAPVEMVYKAWLDPRVLRRWLAPGSAEVEKVEVDERVGGRFRLWQSRDGQIIGGFEAEILELVHNQRIVFNWGLVGPNRLNGPIYDSVLTITFRAETSDVTTLTLVHEHLDALWAAMPECAEQFEAGWQNVLDKLAGALT